MFFPPQVPLEYSQLPHDSKSRHEALVDAFGFLFVSLRNQSLQRVHDLVRSKEMREQLGALFREPYDEVAQLSPQQQQIAIGLARNSIDLFARIVLTMLAGKGLDQTLGASHAICFRLEMEIKDLATGEVVDEETINRDGKRHFPEYWGRWLNRFGRANSEEHDDNEESH